MTRQTLAQEFAHVRDDGLSGEQYVADYNRGFKSFGSLDAADFRNESEAWYDGHADNYAGREKWHFPRCYPAGTHHNGVGGCGAA
jgi:hypothetical protein